MESTMIAMAPRMKPSVSEASRLLALAVVALLAVGCTPNEAAGTADASPDLAEDLSEDVAVSDATKLPDSAPRTEPDAGTGAGDAPTDTHPCGDPWWDHVEPGTACTSAPDLSCHGWCGISERCPGWLDCHCVDGKWTCDPDSCAPIPGVDFCPCATAEDCDGGICGDSPDGLVCIANSMCECPDDNWFTTTWDFDRGDMLFVYLHRHTRLCDPCHDSKDCAFQAVPSACVPYGDAGSFCASPCAGGGWKACPTGYTCTPTESVEGVAEDRCVRTDDSGKPVTCACSKMAIIRKAATTCQGTVGLAGEGTACAGARFCGPDGLTDCVCP